MIMMIIVMIVMMILEPGFGELVVERIGDRVWEYASQPFSSWIIYTLLVAPETKSKVR